MNQKLTQERLKELLHYDHETGVFIWIGKPNKRLPAGTPAGTINTRDNSITITINSKHYFAHRLVFLYVHGFIPTGSFVDHIDRNPSNNRVSNLRIVSHQCNLRNTGNHKTTTSGVKGVSWVNRDGSWNSHIQVNNKSINLGNFDDFIEAVAHRLAAEQAENWSGCDSYSPAFKYVLTNIQNTTKRTLS